MNAENNEEIQPMKQDDGENGGLKITSGITDINTYCHENIFIYLSLGELLNVYNTCKVFREAAKSAFIVKYRKKLIIIGNIEKDYRRFIYDRNDYIRITDLRTIMQLLQNFGAFISKLEIDIIFPTSNEELARYDVKSFESLINYIEVYCSESLTCLTIKQIPVQLLKLLTRSFLKMTNIAIETVNSPDRLDENWCHQLFPNVEYLKYESGISRFDSFKWISTHFVHLKYLDISYGSNICKHLFGPIQITDEQIITLNQNLMTMLRLNPQLTKLKLPYIPDYGILRSISENQPQLESLQFQYRTNDEVNTYIPPVHLKSIKKLKMAFCRRHYLPLDPEMQSIPILLENLEHLTIQTFFQFSHSFFQFIEKHKTIVHLHMRSCSVPQSETDINKSLLVRALPNLKEFHFMCHLLDVTTALEFAESFRFLEKLCFRLENFDDFGDFERQLNPKWDCNTYSVGALITLVRKS